jgi:GH25 family lysozyme M1 (1,4-beta-N-acetylmuramidase)
VFDFGSVIEKSQHFIPSLYTVPYEFRGRVGPNEAARYTLQVIADNFVSQNFVYEVAWNGQWSDNLDNMQQNLTIAKIPNGDKP